MSGFLMANYCCSACGSTYDRKEQHNCGGVCRMCYQFNEECLTLDIQPCQDCGTFRNSQCFTIHKQVRHNGAIYCYQLFLCKHCGVFVSLLRRGQQGAQHKCEELYCETCDAFVQLAGHLCYLWPLKAESISNDLPKHMYFDFKTWVKPDERHTPAMVIAQSADGTKVRFPKDNQPIVDS